MPRGQVMDVRQYSPELSEICFGFPDVDLVELPSGCISLDNQTGYVIACWIETVNQQTKVILLVRTDQLPQLKPQTPVTLKENVITSFSQEVPSP